MINKISGRDLVKEVLIRFFTCSIPRTIINTLIPILISIYSLKYSSNVKWYWFIPIILLTLFILIYNIVAELILNRQTKNIKYWELLEDSYRSHCNINKRSAIKIYRLNKIINVFLKKKQPIDKSIFGKMADFQTIAFDVCNSIYKIIEKEFGIDTNCEVTVYKATDEGVCMIAYANKNDEPPISYNRTYFNKTAKQYLFGKIFRDLNAQIFVCPNQDAVKSNFKYIEGSEIREKQICQYIGIPLLTPRKKIELLLQIDVSKPNIFGKTEEEVRDFAENIFMPYIVLLNKTYERDLIFNGYYDIIEKTLSKTEDSK